MTNFESAALELERTYVAKDWRKIQRLLTDLWQIEFHKHRGKCASSWEKLFQTLLALTQSEDEGITDSAYHYLFIVLQLEYGPPYEDRDQGREQRRIHYKQRIEQCLPTLRINIQKKPPIIFRLMDNIVHTEQLCDAGPLPGIIQWLEDLKKNGDLSSDAFQIVEMAYVFSRMPWDEAKQKLFPLLDHPVNLVRAYAARTLGEFYSSGGDHLNPSLKEIISDITSKEIERPGIAGPLLNAYYDFEVDLFEKQSGLKIEDWFLEILSKRKAPEPDTLPCSNGIDFFAHELFGGRSDYIRKLLDLGYKELALDAATEVNERIDDLLPLLIELGNDEDPEICRRACRHLAHYYQYLHSHGEKMGFIKKILLGKEAELYVNYYLFENEKKYPYSGILYPNGKSFFRDEEAWKYINKIMPSDIRDEQIPHPASVQRKPEPYILGNGVSYAYARAIVSLKGDATQKQWRQIEFIWRGTRGAWSPEKLR